MNVRILLARVAALRWHHRCDARAPASCVAHREAIDCVRGAVADMWVQHTESQVSCRPPTEGERPKESQTTPSVAVRRRLESRGALGRPRRLGAHRLGRTAPLHGACTVAMTCAQPSSRGCGDGRPPGAPSWTTDTAAWVPPRCIAPVVPQLGDGRRGPISYSWSTAIGGGRARTPAPHETSGAAAPVPPGATPATGRYAASTEQRSRSARTRPNPPPRFASEQAGEGRYERAPSTEGERNGPTR